MAVFLVCPNEHRTISTALSQPHILAIDQVSLKGVICPECGKSIERIEYTKG